MSYKYAILSICYNEAKYIKACIKNWEDVVDKHLVLVSRKPWNGIEFEDDGTFTIAKECGAEVILGEWKTEAEQRNIGIARLHDYDYVLIVDPDELYTKSDQQKILSELDNPRTEAYRKDRNIPAFTVSKITTYWKNYNYIFDPPDKHKPIIAVDPMQVYCTEHRQFKLSLNDDKYLPYIKPVDVECHHFSWAKTNKKVLEKIQSYSHAEAIPAEWYENIWEKWKPGCDIKVKPYGKEESMAVFKPAPQEIINLLN